jgi:hypothetical protein
MTKTKIKIGDKVEAGERGTEDHDTGRVVAIDENDHGWPVTAYVKWDSGVSTPYPAAELRKI